MRLPRDQTGLPAAAFKQSLPERLACLARHRNIGACSGERNAVRRKMLRPQSNPVQRSRSYPMQKPMLLTCGFILGAALSPLHAQTLRVAMTTSDIPTTGGIPDNGSEGGPVAGHPIFYALVRWDFTKSDAIADLTTRISTKWHIDPADHKRWIFT